MADVTKEDLSNIALAAAKEACRSTLNETFALLGTNLSNFEDLKRLRDDLQFVHHLRAGAGKMGARFVLSLVSVISGAVAIGAWEFIRASIAGHH